MSNPVVQEYVSIGGNRHSAASSWSRHSGLLAFGADQNIAIWDPLSNGSRGIEQLLHRHKDKVTAVDFLSGLHGPVPEYLISGSADGKLLTWIYDSSRKTWQCKHEVEAHQGAINCIATLTGSELVATGGADASARLWKISGCNIAEVLTIVPKPRLIPLTLILGSFPRVKPSDAVFLAAGGTRNDVQVYACKDLSQQPSAEHQATLTGHEGWIRSLCLKYVNEEELMLASSSHDKYVRLWRLSHSDVNLVKKDVDPTQIASFETTLTAKVQTVSVANVKYSISFEALLLGHEDWIYSAEWNPTPGSEQLLTASADGSLAIWELDSSSGIWISAFRLGEISGQKGATTATGSSGGFWTGMWSPDGKSVTCLGRTGSWRIWQFDNSQQFWIPKNGVSGHVGAANGLTWSLSGHYLLSTSSDQTTRLHAEWKRDVQRTWHEFARPQIHGYDLNCVSSTGNHQFTSGADEKLLRVFNEPRDIANMLTRLCAVPEPENSVLSEAAAMPVLGLSNKAMVDGEEGLAEANNTSQQDYITPDLNMSLALIDEPPTEDLLARHTLWPEHEKLYGHGYEIFESAYSAHNQILATACKASSTDYAVIRLYNTADWNEIKPPLTAHSLTVTRLTWSCSPSNFLLSVGRDRQWAVFGQDDHTKSWKVVQSNAKAHTRMILDATWSPIGSKLFFATAGRDKAVKIWYAEDGAAANATKFEEYSAMKQDSAVTALGFTCSRNEHYAVLAVGEESGALSIHIFSVNQQLALIKSVEIDQDFCPSKSVTRLTWRVNSHIHTSDHGGHQLAVAAMDGSVRIMAIDVEGLCKLT